MTDSLDVFLTFDGAYALPATVTLASLAANVTAKCRVFAVIHDVPASLRDQIERTAPEVEIHWIEPDEELLGAVDVSSTPGLHYISRATLWSLLVDVLLPSDVDRVVALDVDVLVRHDPTPLRDIDLAGRPFGAASDAQLTSIGRAVPGWRAFDVAPRSPYFNAGVLVIDRAEWGRRGIGRRAIEILANHPGELSYNEQDALNLVVDGGWTPMPWAWNVQAPVFWGFGIDGAPVYEVHDVSEIDEALRDPSIVHYSGSRKPWLGGGSALPFWDEWAAVKTRTTWALEPPSRRPSGPVVTSAVGRLRRAVRVLTTGG